MRQPVMTAKQQTFMKEGDEAGLRDGIGVPLRGLRGAIAGIGAASSAGGVALDDPNLVSRVNLLSHQFYTVYLSLELKRLPEGGEPEHIYLNDREQEILPHFTKSGDPLFIRALDGRRIVETVMQPRGLAEEHRAAFLRVVADRQHVISPAPDGGELRIIEHGEVYNPIFGFVSRFVVGHTATIEKTFQTLAKKFGVLRFFAILSI